jgi:hypothetical protein
MKNLTDRCQQSCESSSRQPMKSADRSDEKADG